MVSEQPETAGSNDPESGSLGGLAARLWQPQPVPSRGPRPSLSRTEIVDAAMKIADTDGLGAVSMARIAKELGRSPMALYRYIESKDELLALMADTAVDSPPASFTEPGDDGWRPGLERWTYAQLEIAQNRPWIMELPLSTLPIGPNRLKWIDRAVALLESEPLSFQEILAIAGWAALFVTAEARLNLEVTQASADGQDPYEGFEFLLTSLADAEDHPAIRRIASEDRFNHFDPQLENVGSGLEVLLNGIEAYVARRRKLHD